MKLSRGHPLAMTLLALGLSAGAGAALAAIVGSRKFGSTWSQLHPQWLILTVLAELLTIPAYVLAHRAVAELEGGPALDVGLAARVVVSGFGPFAVTGGFAIDKRALQAVGNDEPVASVRVLGLGALEWAVLAPAAWLSAVGLLMTGRGDVKASLLWPWAVAVPVGFAIALAIATPARARRLASARGRVRRSLGLGLGGIGVLRSLARNATRCLDAWLGMAAYWALDIASLYGAVRFLGLHLGIGATVLAYATGYALTRRSMPFGGAGLTEAMITLSLHWVGLSLAAALAAALVYRLFNLILPALPALFARRDIEHALEGRSPSTRPADRASSQRSRAGKGLEAWIARRRSAS